MLALLLLSTSSCISANNSDITASSSSREVGRRQQGQALKTPGSLNRVRSNCVVSSTCGMFSSLGSSSATIQRSILPAFTIRATASCVSAGLPVLHKARPKLTCATAVSICLMPFTFIWMRRDSFWLEIASCTLSACTFSCVHRPLQPACAHSAASGEDPCCPDPSGCIRASCAPP